MYKIVYRKKAIKDIQKLKMQGLSDKGKRLIQVIKNIKEVT